MVTDADIRFMRAALGEARNAGDEGDVPVGAVIVHDDRIIGRGHNQRELLQDPTAHAEMIAITAAAAALGSWRLLDCTLYVTLEPCVMCAGALVQARLPRLIFGAMDPKAGACGSIYRLVDDGLTNHVVAVTSGLLADESRELLQQFFQDQRRQGKK